jgi:tetratricopeptide (TPR) repeat protein
VWEKIEMNRYGTGLYAGLFFVLAFSLPVMASDPGGRADVSGYDFAWKFAAAIETAPKDRSMAMQSVVQDLATDGHLDLALAHVDAIEGWRKGTAMADLAIAMVEAGREDDALSLVKKAREHRNTIKGWQNPRIAAHIADALAFIGETSESEELAGKVATHDRQYTGRAAATVATGLARKGEFDEALSRLSKMEDNKDFYVSHWVTSGYIQIAGYDGLDKKQRRKALESAARSSGNIAGWARAESINEIAARYLDLGEKQKAAELLEEAYNLVAPLSDTTTVKAALLADLAITFGRAGKSERAVAILQEARPIIEQAMLTERPILVGKIAGGYAGIGGNARALEAYREALDLAGGLVNSRPRAMAIVAICRSMGRHLQSLDPKTASQLETLLGGLGEPW